MVYTLLFGPVVCTLCPCFPRKMVSTIVVFCSVTSRGRATDRERRGATVVYLYLRPEPAMYRESPGLPGRNPKKSQKGSFGGICR